MISFFWACSITQPLFHFKWWTWFFLRIALTHRWKYLLPPIGNNCWGHSINFELSIDANGPVRFGSVIGPPNLWKKCQVQVLTRTSCLRFTGTLGSDRCARVTLSALTLFAGITRVAGLPTLSLSAIFWPDAETCKQETKVAQQLTGNSEQATANKQCLHNMIVPCTQNNWRWDMQCTTVCKQ
jgi:hypothetical protein